MEKYWKYLLLLEKEDAIKFTKIIYDKLIQEFLKQLLNHLPFTMVYW